MTDVSIGFWTGVILSTIAVVAVFMIPSNDPIARTGEPIQPVLEINVVEGVPDTTYIYYHPQTKRIK